jgi:hypothetical protein
MQGTAGLGRLVGNARAAAICQFGSIIVTGNCSTPGSANRMRITPPETKKGRNIHCAQSIMPKLGAAHSISGRQKLGMQWRFRKTGRHTDRIPSGL